MCRGEPVILNAMQSDHRHNFIELPSAQARGGYFKQSTSGLFYDQSRSYTMLYCPGCGETKEVVSRDASAAKAAVSPSAKHQVPVVLAGPATPRSISTTCECQEPSVSLSTEPDTCGAKMQRLAY